MAAAARVGTDSRGCRWCGSRRWAAPRSRDPLDALWRGRGSACSRGDTWGELEEGLCCRCRDGLLDLSMSSVLAPGSRLGDDGSAPVSVHPGTGSSSGPFACAALAAGTTLGDCASSPRSSSPCKFPFLSPLSPSSPAPPSPSACGAGIITMSASCGVVGGDCSSASPASVSARISSRRRCLTDRMTSRTASISNTCRGWDNTPGYLVREGRLGGRCAMTAPYLFCVLIVACVSRYVARATSTVARWPKRGGWRCLGAHVCPRHICAASFHTRAVSGAKLPPNLAACLLRPVAES